MPYITTNDQTRLFYEDWGSGKPAVFVSSWGLGNQMWEYQTVPLSHVFKNHREEKLLVNPNTVGFILFSTRTYS